jgi:hypothetical protein
MFFCQAVSFGLGSSGNPWMIALRQIELRHRRSSPGGIGLL